MIRIDSIVLCLAMPLLASGCGMASVRALDDANGWPIQGASVEITDAYNSTKVVGTTDWQGEVLFVAPKNIRSVTIKRDGYQPYTGPMHYTAYEEMSLEARLVPVGAEGTGFERLKDIKAPPGEFDIGK